MAARGLTMQAIAEALNGEGLRSVTGKPFYAKLVGALLSKTRRKSGEGKFETLIKTMLRIT